MVYSVDTISGGYAFINNHSQNKSKVGLVGVKALEALSKAEFIKFDTSNIQELSQYFLAQCKPGFLGRILEAILRCFGVRTHYKAAEELASEVSKKTYEPNHFIHTFNQNFKLLSENADIEVPSFEPVNKQVMVQALEWYQKAFLQVNLPKSEVINTLFAELTQKETSNNFDLFKKQFLFVKEQNDPESIIIRMLCVVGFSDVLTLRGNDITHIKETLALLDKPISSFEDYIILRGARLLLQLNQNPIQYLKSIGCVSIKTLLLQEVVKRFTVRGSTFLQTDQNFRYAMNLVKENRDCCCIHIIEDLIREYKAADILVYKETFNEILKDYTDQDTKAIREDLANYKSIYS
jgi:hypothetical protein